MPKQTPSIGRMVLFTHFNPNDPGNNGSPTCAAVITRCWGPSQAHHDGQQHEMVNLTVFPDMRNPFPQGSVFEADTVGVAGTWCWPPHVGPAGATGPKGSTGERGATGGG